MENSFPKRLRVFMEERGLKQITLEKETGIKQNTISAWLNGRKAPALDSLWILADYFETDIDYLIGRSDVDYGTNEHFIAYRK